MTRYPLFVHLENHCSIRQQLVVAHILEQTLGDALYIPSQYADVEMQTPLAALSPKDLIGKIILAVSFIFYQSCKMVKCFPRFY